MAAPPYLCGPRRGSGPPLAWLEWAATPSRGAPDEGSLTMNPDVISRRTLGALGAAVVAACLGLTTLPAIAAPRTDVNIGIRLEPTHLDPTAGAAAAIGEVVYANVFEGLTR